jgi:hypothetical protein
VEVGPRERRMFYHSWSQQEGRWAANSTLTHICWQNYAHVTWVMYGVSRRAGGLPLLFVC